MTRLEAEQKVKYYRDKWSEYQKILDKMDMVFDIPDLEKPFGKYTLPEQQKLYQISEKAYEYSIEHKEENIYDYNLLSAKDNKITLAR